jgi:hypothetical protein
MNNLMPGDNSGAEPREHDERCPAACYDAYVDDCPLHDGHPCTCDELAEQDAEREAEAYVNWLYDTTP